MSITKTEIRPGAYFDSIVLMQLQRALTELPEVEDAGVVMGTPANLALLEEGGLLTPSARSAKPDDLLIIVKAEDEKSATSALGQVDTILANRRSKSTTEFRPRSMESALKELPSAKWVLISVPGKYATAVTQNALELNRHVFLYSDNVPLEDEIKLKQIARQKGLFLMGPDCGTALINGIGLGFANRVRRGNIGLIGASGTGLQAISVAIHNLGGGISQAIGTGGRDLTSQVGGLTSLQALDALRRDPNTSTIVLVSKPPEPAVATRLLAEAQLARKPVVINFIGHPLPTSQLNNLYFAPTLQEAASVAMQVIQDFEDKKIRQSGKSSGYLRGLFSGGTLAYETVLGLQSILAPLYTNVPLNEKQRLQNVAQSVAHTVIDLGDDTFTVGRLHPMIDNDLRIRRMQQEAADPDVGLLLLDLVLGEGAHPNPAEEFAPIIHDLQKKRTDLKFVFVVIGSDKDPQKINKQVKLLEEAGATVFFNTTEAIEFVSQAFSSLPKSEYPPIPIEDLQSPLSAVNIGLESFFDSLQVQGAEVVQVDWRPPAGGNEKLMAILSKMKGGGF